MTTTEGADLANNTFDFVIVGGGTAGLALAVRLTEDPNVSVAVLEAGGNTIDDPAIEIPGQFGLTIGDPKYDWCFYTTTQRDAGNRKVLWSRGKGLGGSSAINSFAWIKPPMGDVDAVEKLGNPGWNWADFHHYSLKSEIFDTPIHEVMESFPHTYDTSVRGTSGPIHHTITPHPHTIDTVVQETCKKLGLEVLEDPYGGNINGTWVASANIDSGTWTRSYSASGYLKPHQGRENLTVLVHAFVSRVLFAETADNDTDDLVAKGVEFLHQGKTRVLNARKEVILSAGTPVTPKILELSGIGQEDVLKKIGVEMKINLLGVGENLQDHVLFGVIYELDPSANHQTLDLLQDPQYAKEARKLISKTPTAVRTAELIAQDIEEYKKKPDTPPGLIDQLNLQLKALHDDSIPEMEIAAFPGMFSTIRTGEPGKVYVSFVGLLNHPVSRGSVHARSNNPEHPPDIDPRYFEKDSDLELLVEHVRYIRRMVEIEPLKSAIVGAEVEPGPEYLSDEQIRDFLRQEIRSAWRKIGVLAHVLFLLRNLDGIDSVGTCSMQPRDKQGVVDPQLKVYGTKNLRIVDLSIYPIHIAAHTQALAYMIAEKAADIILTKYRSEI
ncbi:hypothetical protein H0H92_008841 [Tricholoma furcatifolium]|nr:hypothetical protein H0H92_008841 [Tricholoma furcatifolium]